LHIRSLFIVHFLIIEASPMRDARFAR
jgi:hypothetical protein